jgi:hypothetical protein
MGSAGEVGYAQPMKLLSSGVPLALWALTAANPAAHAQRAGNEAIPVRFAEGTVHGFLELHTAAGEFLAHGDLLQLPRKGGIDSRMTFRFVDGSSFEETVVFTQHSAFEMESYHLVQRGPAFSDDLDATLARSGVYSVKTKSHKTGEEKVYNGSLAMPADVYDGMIVVIAKNLAPNEAKTVHLVAFTPEPRMIQLDFVPSEAAKVPFGKSSETAMQFTVKPRLGGLTGFFARVLGKIPPDSHVWIVTDEVPTFARFQGPLFTGPVWRIDLAAPSWK